MIIRALDASHDWQFGQGTESYLSGELAIGENIQTRVLSFMNNCFFDMNAGIDWFTYLGIPGQSQEVLLRVKAVILQSYGVVKVNSLNIHVNEGTRGASITYNIDTLYSKNYSQSIQVVNYA